MNFLYELIKLNRLVRSHRIKFAGLLLADILRLRYLIVRIDPVNACNLRCVMCHFSDEHYRQRHKGHFTRDDFERLAALFFPQTLQLAVGCTAEPTVHADYLSVIRLGRRYHVPFISLVTNAQNISPGEIRDFMNLGLNEITVSTHGVLKKTYESLMTNASHDKHHSFLRELDRIKSDNKSVLPALRVNYTVNPDNLEELSSFFDTYGPYHIRTLQIRPIIDFGENVIYKKKDMAPYLSRYHQIIDKLGRISASRNITFLATRVDPTFKAANYSSVVLEPVVRLIRPDMVWKTDFLWRQETYREYCGRTGWRRRIFRDIFKRLDDIATINEAATSDVF